MAESRRTSASGEQAAVRGFEKQYEYSACMIYKLMQDNAFEWVSISDDKAGIFDDLLLSSQGKVIATQVKTEKEPKPVALHTQLISNQLIRDMVDSWIQLERKYGQGKISLHYIFGGYFSTNDSKLADSNIQGPRHSAEFARFLNHKDLNIGNIENSRWAESFRQLRNNVQLEKREFLRFINSLKISDCQELQKNRMDSFPPSERSDLNGIQALLPKLVVQKDKKSRWTEEDLIKELGWHTRLSQQHSHDFPVPDNFQENDETKQALLQAIHCHKSGYISLVGPPGTGKSTLLQRTLFSTLDFNVARYLAFLPDRRHGWGRAESTSFLNDLIAALTRLGFRGSKFWRRDANILRDDLRQQLNEASDLYRKTGRKTIIILDGLDHVPREEKPERSFLKELPSIQSVPEGVIFVLGTQRLDLDDLHQTIRQQAGHSGRFIEITPLPRSAIFQMADIASLPLIVERKELYMACDGHPLTAHYFIEALKNVNDIDSVKRILSHTDGLGRGLEEIYQRVWNSLQVDQEAKHILGLLARAEGAVSAQELAKSVNDNAVENVLKHSGFLLSRANDSHLAIFHNSFRLFVAGETKKRFGNADETIEREFNQGLAKIAARVLVDDPQHWMELRYRARAGEEDIVLQIGTPEYFRKSLLSYRPPNEIYNDLRLTYRAIKHTRDRIALLSMLLVEKELEYRLEALSEIDLVEVFLTLNEPEQAIKHAIDKSYSGQSWPQLIDYLWGEGRLADARRIFEANEPNILLGEKLFRAIHDDLSSLGRWIYQATLFRPPEDLVSIIKALKVDSPIGGSSREERSKMELLYCVARGVIAREPESDVKNICLRFGLSDEYIPQLIVEAAQIALRSGNRNLAIELIQEINSNSSIEQLKEQWKEVGALLAYKLNKKKIAKKILHSVKVPLLDGFSAENSVRDCRSIYVYCVLNQILGCDIQINHVSNDELLVKLKKKIAELANIRASIENNTQRPTFSELKSIISFLAHIKSEAPTHSMLGSRLHMSLGWFAETIIDIAQRSGEEVFSKTISFIDSLLAQNGNRLFGSEKFRLAFAYAAFLHDKNKDNACRRIKATQDLIEYAGTPQEAVELQINIAKAFGRIGMLDRARECLAEVHQDTFGYFLPAKKDAQYEFWIDAFLNACSAKVDESGNYALEFGRFILGMDQTEGYDTARRVVRGLLRGAVFSPAVAAGLVNRLVDSHHLTSWAKMIAACLEGVVRAKPELTLICVEVFSRLVVPFYSSSEYHFVSIALNILKESTNKDKAVEKLVYSIIRWCPLSERTGLLEKILESAPEQDIVVKALDVARVQAQRLYKQHQSSGEHNEFDPKKEYPAESLDQLLALGDGKSDYGNGVDYTYARAATTLVGNANEKEIRNFLEKCPHVKNDTRFIVACSRSMWKQNEKLYSDELFNLAEQGAFVETWTRFWGGEKLELQRLRVEREGNVGREKGFDILVDDLADSRTSGGSLFIELTEILDLISIDLPWVEIWKEVAPHLKQYREYRLAQEIMLENEIDNHEAFIAFLLALAYDFSCPEILDHARASTLEIAKLKGGVPIIRTLISMLEKQSNGSREAAALIFRSRNFSHLRAVLIEPAKRLSGHSDFVVSMQSKIVLHEFGIHNNDGGNKSVGLPEFYRLKTVGNPQTYDFKRSPGLRLNQSPVWSDDPWTWTEMLEHPLLILDEHTDVKMEILRRRCAEFMRREGGREAFGPDPQQRVMQRLEGMELKFLYHRLLPLAAQRGFGKVLNELVYAKEIDERTVRRIWPEIGGPSLADFNLDIEPRPEWLALPSIPHSEHGVLGGDQDVWLNAAENELHIPLPPGMQIIGEFSISKVCISWDVFTSSRITLPNIHKLDDMNQSLYKMPRLMSIDFCHPLYEEAESKILCVVSDYYFGDLRNLTLTLCPYLVDELGWQRSQSNPFEIYDNNGDLMVRTLRWVDGTDRMASGGDVEFFGFGQFVLLNPVARKMLEDRREKLMLETKLTHRVESAHKSPIERTLNSTD